MTNSLTTNRDLMGRNYRDVTKPSYDGPIFPSGGPGTPGGGAFNPVGGGVGGALGIAGAINASDLAFTRGAEMTDPTYGMIQNLLNPNWSPQLYDSAQHGAEDAAMGGISGSNLANFRGARIYSDDLKQNAALANSLLTGAHGRVPTPFNPDRLITSPLDQARLNQEMTLSREREAGETNRALIAAASRGGGGGAGRGGSVHDPGGGTGVQGGWSGMPTLGGGRTGGGSTPFNGGGWTNGIWTGNTTPRPSPTGNQVQFDYNPIQSGSDEELYYGTGGEFGGDTGNFDQVSNEDFYYGTGGEFGGGGGNWWDAPVTVDNFEDFVPA